MEEEKLYKLPIYPIFYKEALLAGIPFNMAIITLLGIAAGILVFNNLIFALIFLIIHLMIFILLKTSKKFDTKIIDILARKTWRKFISY